MVIINKEGKFNDNIYLIDGNLYKLKGALALYIIENNDTRMLIDTSSSIAVRIVAKKLSDMNLLPIHKVFLTHSHWDHCQSIAKLKARIGEFEVLASESAIENLKHPERTNEGFGYNVNPIEDVIPLKDDEIINLNGLELKVLNFFGHTQDSIALLDTKNRNIFIGDTLSDRHDEGDYISPLIIPDFREEELLKTFQKIKSMRGEFDSISLPHYGVWKDEHKEKFLAEMEDLYFETKKSTIQWYNENPSLDIITEKYREKFTPNSLFHSKEHINSLKVQIEWFLDGLKLYGFLD